MSKQSQWSKVRVVVSCVVVALLTAGSLAQEPKDDARNGSEDSRLSASQLRILRGTWKNIGGEEDGKNQDRRVVKALELTITFSQGTFRTRIFNGQGAGGRIRLYPSTNPKHIDFTFDEGSLSGQTRLGVYEVRGNSLKVCWGKPGGADRPTGFKTKKDDGFTLDLFTRTK